MTAHPNIYYLYVVGFNSAAPQEPIPLGDSLSEVKISAQPHQLCVDLDLTKIPAGVRYIRFVVEDREEANPSSW